MVSLRKAGIQDLKSLAILFDAYRVFYGNESNVIGAEKFLSERIGNNESEIFISIEEGTNVVTGFVQLYPIFSSTRMKRLWLLNDLYVLPEYRGRGISHFLLNEAKKLSSRTNASGLLLETAKDNVVGNKLYPSAGFVLDIDHNYYYWNE